MKDFSIKVEGNAYGNIRYAQEHLSSWMTSAVGDKAHEYRDYVRMTFSRYLTSRTGETADSIQAWIPKRNLRSGKSEWYIRPGVRIPGMLNYLFMWVGTSKDFMNGSFGAWKTKADIVGYAARRIEERFENLRG